MVISVDECERRHEEIEEAGSDMRLIRQKIRFTEAMCLGYWLLMNEAEV